MKSKCRQNAVILIGEFNFFEKFINFTSLYNHFSFFFLIFYLNGVSKKFHFIFCVDNFFNFFDTPFYPPRLFCQAFWPTSLKFYCKKGRRWYLQPKIRILLKKIVEHLVRKKGYRPVRLRNFRENFDKKMMQTKFAKKGRRWYLQPKIRILFEKVSGDKA